MQNKKTVAQSESVNFLEEKAVVDVEYEPNKKNKVDSAVHLLTRIARQRTPRLYDLASLDVKNLFSLRECDRKSLISTQEGTLLLDLTSNNASTPYNMLSVASPQCFVNYTTVKRRFDFLTSGLFRDWDFKRHNMIVAGGALTACLRHVQYSDDGQWFSMIVQGVYSKPNLVLQTVFFVLLSFLINSTRFFM